MKILCDIYKTKKESDLYLYVRQEDGLAKVPDELLKRFGTPEKAMTLVISPDKKLARAKAEKVLQELDDKGFYLQLPPSPFRRVEQ